MALELGRVYEFDMRDEGDNFFWNDRGRRWAPEIEITPELGAYVGEWQGYRMFITETPNEFFSSYLMVYVEPDVRISDTDLVTNIPMLSRIIHYVNSPEFQHPLEMDTNATTRLVIEDDVLTYANRHLATLTKNIKAERNKRKTRRARSKAAKKIGNWMSLLPPAMEFGFSGGPLYKRARNRFDAQQRTSQPKGGTRRARKN
jgi:hypothetical protein